MKPDLLASLPLGVARKVVVAVVGATLVVVGVALMFLPGPGTVVLILALSVLAAEFAWARRWLRKLKQTATEASQQLGLEMGTDEAGTDAAGQDANPVAERPQQQ